MITHQMLHSKFRFTGVKNVQFQTCPLCQKGMSERRKTLLLLRLIPLTLPTLPSLASEHWAPNTFARILLQLELELSNSNSYFGNKSPCFFNLNSDFQKILLHLLMSLWSHCTLVICWTSVIWQYLFIYIIFGNAV